jgi:hypothetical protein
VELPAAIGTLNLAAPLYTHRMRASVFVARGELDQDALEPAMLTLHLCRTVIEIAALCVRMDYRSCVDTAIWPASPCIPRNLAADRTNVNPWPGPARRFS